MSGLKFFAKDLIDPEIQGNPATIGSIKYASPKHTHDFYEFFLITDGCCIHRVNGGEQYLSEGDVVFVRPEDTHSYDYVNGSSGDCEFININCTREIIREVFLYLGDKASERVLTMEEMPYFARLTASEKDDFLDRYERFKLLCIIDKLRARIQLKGLLVEMLTQYFTLGKSMDSSDMPLWFETLLTRMQKKDNYTSGLQRMYDLSGRSIGHLNRVFKQYLNTTPTSYINHLRLSYAKSLLLTTDLNVVGVSMEAGFENLSHFYHLFKKEFKTSPSDFRRKRTSK